MVLSNKTSEAIGRVVRDNGTVPTHGLAAPIKQAVDADYNRQKNAGR